MGEGRGENSPKSPRIEPLNLVGTRCCASRPSSPSSVAELLRRVDSSALPVHGEGKREIPLKVLAAKTGARTGFQVNSRMLEHDLIPAREKNSCRLMIMLHGLGDSMEGYRWLPEAMNLPWMNYLLVNAPDEYFGGYSWFDFQGDMVPGVARSRKLLFELLDALRAKGFPTDQTTFGGFSQGSLMATEVGLRYPHRFAGVVGISGYVCEPEKLVKELSPVARQQQFLITHGTLDPMIPFAKAREQINLLKAAGLKIEWHEFAKAHTILEPELELMRDFVRAGYPQAAG
jgi:phospholipase/carboxylesterase